MTSRVLLLSHAATAASRSTAFPRDESIEAGAVGEAARAFAWPRHFDCRSGPEARARETAAALGITAAVDPALRDIDNGRWAGRSFEAVAEMEPEAANSWVGDPEAAPHGGESVVDVVDRVRPWLDAARQDGLRILGVTSPAIVRAAAVIALEAGPGSFWRVDAGPLTLLELVSDGRRWTLRQMRPL